MSKFTDHLWRDLVQDHGPALMHAGRPEPGRVRRPRPRVLAGSTLALAGAGAALMVGLSTTGSTPALAVTRSGDGSLVVQLNQINSLPHVVNPELNAIGVYAITIHMASGTAPVPGPVTCTKEPGVSGPPVKILVGTNGTEVIAADTTAGNTGAGTWHLASCQVFGASGPGNSGSGNSGSGKTGNTGAG
jgi:hypothetical protein